MKRTVAFALVALFLTGCGGSSSVSGTGAKSSTVTGTLYDSTITPVIGATVQGLTRTTSSSTGAFVLTNEPDGYDTIEATVVKGGVQYRGSTVVFNSANTQSTSVGIIMAPASEMANISGNVTDQAGHPLQDVSIFAYTPAGGTSKRAVTDADGNYEMNDVVAGITFTVSATGGTYRSDQVSVTVVPSETRTENFVLGGAGTPALVAPTNLNAVTYVSYPSANIAGVSPLDWIKAREAKAGHKSVTTTKISRIRSDMRVEAQLDWLYSPTTETRGYGIYRSSGVVTSPAGYDFFYDPLATTFFDSGLQPNSTYTYAVTSTSSNFPDNAAVTESALSNVAQVQTLNLLPIGSFVPGTKTFSWSGSSGATSYIVYLFDGYPSVNQATFWANDTAPTSSTSLVYSGPTLTAGHTYYWFVQGTSNAGKSRTISQVSAFKA